jgi:hypothetical protein
MLPLCGRIRRAVGLSSRLSGRTTCGGSSETGSDDRFSGGEASRARLGARLQWAKPSTARPQCSSSPKAEAMAMSSAPPASSGGTRREASGSVRTASRSLRGRAMTLASPAALGRAAAQRLLHRLRLIEQINYGQSGGEHTLVFSPPRATRSSRSPRTRPTSQPHTGRPR